MTTKNSGKKAAQQPPGWGDRANIFDNNQSSTTPAPSFSQSHPVSSTNPFRAPTPPLRRHSDNSDVVCHLRKQLEGPVPRCIAYTVETFGQLARINSIMMDKTMFVIHVMMKTESTGIYQYFYITLPRKSGKSILLDTVGYFCEDWQLRKGFEAAQKCWNHVKKIKNRAKLHYSITNSLESFEALFDLLLDCHENSENFANRLNRAIQSLREELGEARHNDSQSICRLEQCLTEFQLAVVDKHWKGIFSAATIAERAAKRKLPHHDAGWPRFKAEEDESFKSSHYQQHPIIRINLLGASGRTYTELAQSILSRVAKAFEQHNYLEWVLEVRQENANLARFQAIRSANFATVGQVNLRESINLLCGLLHRAYGRQVVLLIDEVDSPINELISAAAGDNNKDEEDQAFKLMSALITNALKLSTADDSLYRGILTGILPIAFEGLSSCDPGRWQVNNIRDEAKYFMFRAEEFKQFCVHFDIEEGVRHQLEDFYNGFEFKIDGKNESFYNNCSIVNYLAQKAPREIQSFRFLKGNIIAPIKDLFEKPVIIEALYDLVASGERYFLKPQQFDLAMYRRLRTAVAKKKAKDIKEEDKKDVLHLLYHLGYLTRSLSTDDGDSESGPSSSKDVLVAIPNGEVCEAFQGILGNEFGPELKLVGEAFRNGLCPPPPPTNQGALGRGIARFTRLAAKKPFDVFKERFAAHLKNVLMKRPKSELKEAVCEWYLADALRRSHGFSHVKPQRQLEHEHKIGHPLTADLYLETWDQGRLVRCILELKWGGKISTATRLRDAILQGEKYGREIFADGGPRTRDVIVAVYVEDNGQGAIAVHVEIKEV